MEIVSPANGSFACVEKVFDSGADAIYAGVRRTQRSIEKYFRNTDNGRSDLFSFNLSKLEKLVSLCHNRRKKIYITLNSSYTDISLKAITGLLDILQSLHVDAIIASDLGLIKTINLYFPKLPIHASVFTSPCNSYTLEFLKEFNVKRAILEDKITLDDVAAIKKRSGIEIEVFATSNFCFSYQGHCFISNYQFGQSCLVSCFEKYKLVNAKTQLPVKYISLKPKITLQDDIISKFAELKVEAIKIEGRQRATSDICQITAFVKDSLNRWSQNKEPLMEQNFSLNKPPAANFFLNKPRIQLHQLFFLKILTWIFFRQIKCLLVVSVSKMKGALSLLTLPFHAKYSHSKSIR